MKLKRLLLGLCVGALGLSAAAEVPYINLTPAPKEITQGEGEFVLPQGLTVSTAGLEADFAAEVTRFVADLNKATGLNASAADQGAISVAVDASIAPEGYQLEVTTSGASVKASTPQGLFYAFQTIKKILPVNVMAGVYKDGTYSLPVLTINDEPRYAYRGYMLDVSRHFFDVDEVKRMIDVMAYYKLNYFHWHLTDDQGWRIEMPKYPKLQTIGATAPDAKMVSLEEKIMYWYGKPYGPYYYTIDQMKEVVAYAKQYHIEVIPEVDMPGHTSAVVAAYPEFSCNPAGAHSVASAGGIYSDVLNVANPEAMQFIFDVIDELCEIFPYKEVHIGGDECPTSAWSNNAECKALMEQEGMTALDQLQSYFTKQVGEYLHSKGKSVNVWNETITAAHANTEQVKALDPTVYCWHPWAGAANKAYELGLKAIYTPHTGYYICRGQNPLDPPSNGGTELDVKKVYLWEPFGDTNATDGDFCYGIQGTYWSESTSSNELLEYHTFPRMQAIAEHGWTPKDKKGAAYWPDFQKRITLDTQLLELNNYRYAPWQLLSDEGEETSFVYPEPGKWYYVASTSPSRTGKVMELISGTNDAAKDDYLYGRDKDAENADWQLWQFIEDPANAHHYAIQNKAIGDGSVNSTAEGSSTNSKWKYDHTALHYDFVFVTTRDNCHGKMGESYFYALQSTKSPADQYVNMAMPGKDYQMNQYGDPNDGNGGIFLLELPADPTAIKLPKSDEWYRMVSVCTDPNRTGKVVELLAEGAPQITTYAEKNAAAGRLWSSDLAAEGAANYDYQWFQFREDPANPGKYAIVCKAQPNGSVKSTPTAIAPAGRWEYDNDNLDYGFFFDVDNSEANADGTFTYLLRTDALKAAGYWFNMSAAAQGYSIHCYNNINDGTYGAYFLFVPLDAEVVEPSEPAHPALPEITQGATYMITNVTPGFEGISFGDFQPAMLGATDDAFQNTIWTATAVSVNADNVASLTLTNIATGRGYASLGTFSAKAGKPVNLGDTPAAINAYAKAEGSEELIISVGGLNFWPQADNACANHSTVAAGSNMTDGQNAATAQGTLWTLTEVTPVSFTCKDSEGNTIFSGVRGVAASQTATDLVPEIANFTLVSATEGAEPNTVEAVYSRAACDVTIRYCLENGALLAPVATQNVALGTTIDLTTPDFGKYFTLKSTNAEGSSVVANQDLAIEYVYTTEATLGIKEVDQPVAAVIPGNVYAIEDAHSGRHAFRYATTANKVAGTREAVDVEPYYVWQIEAVEGGVSIQNVGSGLYVQAVTNNNQGTLGKNAATYEIIDRGSSLFTIKNGANDQCWDGQDNLNMVGWGSGGHPHKFYEFVAEPYFLITIHYQDAEGNQVKKDETLYVKAGSEHTLVVPDIKKYEFVSHNAEGLDCVEAHTEVTLTYKSAESGLEELSTINRQLSTVYNLQGQRLTKAGRPGIYIINGTKTLVK